MSALRKGGFVFKNIISKLKELRDEIEAMDDPTDDEDIRDKIGYAHFHIEECIENIGEI